MTTTYETTNTTQPLNHNAVVFELPSLLDVESTPFIPQLNAPVRDINDIMRDHGEVEKVVKGGVGTSAPVVEFLSDGSSTQESIASTASNATLSLLPFATCEDLPSLSGPARPLLKTGLLKELKVTINGRVFFDRSLPASAKTITPHPRFTPTYYTALHNLVASAGFDGNGFSYSANTPNYKGARIPLVHTGLNIDSWRKHLIGYEDDLELLQYMEYGFPLGLVDSPDLSPCDRNHGSAYQFYTHLDKFVTSEILTGGLTGPFSSAPWENLMISPLMTAPKKPSSRRPVFDATFGDKSLNNSTPGDLYLGTPTLYTYPKVDDLRKIILTCGQACYLWKRDLHRFYLQIPMDPVEYQYVGCVWRGLVFFFVTLMFGLRHSGLQGQRITDALSWIHRRLGLLHGDGRMFNCINYSDDLGGGESTKERADLSFTRLGIVLEELGLAESVDKARAPNTEMVYLGVQFNTVTMTMSVPPDKLAELKEEIERWYKKTTTAKKPLQSLLGKLFWVSRVVKHSRTFMSRLLKQLREIPINPANCKVKLSEDCRKDLLWWRTFLKVYNGVTMIENEDAIQLSLPQLIDTPFTVCVGDATLTGGGAWHGSSYWSRQFPHQLKDPQIPVHVKEFLVVTASAKLWGSSWAGKVIQIFCDNDPVSDVISGERPSDPKMMSLLREFKYLVCTFKFYPVLRKISSGDNIIADHISRRHDPEAATTLFAAHGLGQMELVAMPDQLFDLTAPW